MSDEKVFGMLSRAFLPAVIVASVFWLMNTFEMRASVFNMPLLIGCYATGAAVLLYAEKGVGVEKEHRLGFYSAYLALVLSGAALGAAMLRSSLAGALTSFMLLPVAMFALPVAFNLIMERVMSVQPQ